MEIGLLGRPRTHRRPAPTGQGPPASQVSPLPPRSTSPQIVVEWGGQDAPSGIATYDLQVRVDGGDFRDWLTGTTMTRAVYMGGLGHTYGFRSRAHDRAGNAEGWPAGPDAETRVVARVRKTYFLGALPVAVRPVGEGGVAGDGAD